jgi:hypothetical protein
LFTNPANSILHCKTRFGGEINSRYTWKVPDRIHKADVPITQTSSPINTVGNDIFRISYKNKMDIGNKLNNYQKIRGIINNVFRPKKTRLKLHNTLGLPPLLYDSEKWTIKARDATRLTAAEMKYIRTAGYTWTHHK